MKKITARRRWLPLLLALLAALSLTVTAFAAEGGEGNGNEGGGNGGGGTSGSARTTFSFRSNTRNFDPGGGDSVVATVHDATRETRIRWSSSDESVLKVTYDAGTLADTAYFDPLKPGTATVTVTALDSGYTQKIEVTVNGIVLLKGNNVSVPENGSVTWTRGVDFERYGTAAEEGVSITLTSDKSNANGRAMTAVGSGKETWVFNGIREGNATITAQARTAGGVNAGPGVEIRVAVTENAATTIIPSGSYSASNPLCFGDLEANIASQCKEMIGDANNALQSVTGLTVDTSTGTLYLGYKSPDDTGMGVGTALSYYAAGSGTGPYLKDVYFVPSPNFKGDKAIITFTGVSQGGRTFKGRISVNITAASTAVKLTAQENTPLKLKGSDFAASFQQVAGVPLASVTFALPSANQGTLYRDYVNETNYAAKVTATDKFTTKELDKVTFVPAPGYVGDVVISYAGYTASGLRYDGEVTITVKQSVDGVISYQDGGMGAVSFKEADFDQYCQRVTGGRMSWVSFSLPAASQGVLYYDWRGSSGTMILPEDKFLYGSTPSVGSVTFVPAEGFSGTARMKFSGENVSGAKFSGTVEVHMQSSGGGMDITYICQPGGSVKFSLNDFNNLSLQLTGQKLHYISFPSLPDYTQGSLFHNRTTAAVMGTRVTSAAKYFSSATPYIMNLSFWAGSAYAGNLEIPFLGASVSGQTFNGSILINTTGVASSGTAGTGAGAGFNNVISYSTIGRSPADFVAAQFDDMCRSATDSALNYVRFSSLPTATQGNVYFDYQRAGTPWTISTSDTFYLSGEFSLSRLSFLPAPGFTGTVSMPFTGWSIAGAQFQGTVQVSVTGGVSGTMVIYTTTGVPVRFSAYDFYNEGGGQPVSLRFDRVPYESQGKLYYQYTNPTHYSWLATAGMQYGFASDPLLANLTFVPKAGFKGEISLPYTATNSNGGTYSGEVRLVVEPTAISTYFTDLEGRSLDVVSAVDYLYSQGVVNGVGNDRYAPTQSIKRGDFCLMLFRAFQFSSQGTTPSFRDVPDSAYYAQAVNVLRSLDIVKGTGSNSFEPNASLTRQDAALMVQRALRAAGMTINDGTEANMAAYSDAAGVDGYARGAVSGLLSLGFLPTSDGKIAPKAALTRADMAVLLHRAMTN